MDSPLVIITGAGASVNLGREGKKLPQMGGWAAHLCKSLDAYKDVLGLRVDMTGEEFESKVGAFLRCSRSLADCKSYVQLGVPNPSSDSVQQYEQWFQQAELACGQIERALFESLHELFGLDQIDAFAAKTAYERLLGILQPVES